MARRLKLFAWRMGVLQLAMCGAIGSALAPQAAAGDYFTTTNATWRIFKGYSEPSSGGLWRQPEFNDASWITAPAPFYYSDTPTEPPFYNGGVFNGTLLTDMINNYTCLYFRKTFQVTNAAAAGAVTIQIAGDDGFIAWLNGVEVGRTNVVAGPIPYNGIAIASLTEPYPVHSFVLNGGLTWLREGTNVLAVQGINSVSNSHDFGFMAGLSIQQELDPAATGSAVLSEFMADNAGSLLDEDGIGSDWIEVHNPGPIQISLSNWCLTDDPTDLAKWRFPATNVAANGYLVVFASGKNRRIPGLPLHANFKLNQSTGYVALVQADGITIASAFGPLYPPQRENISYGIAADGATNFFLTPTPGAANGIGFSGWVADTSFTVNRGFFHAPTNVVVATTTPGATLVYTLNGTEPSPTNGAQVSPTNASTPPGVSIGISNTTLLRAMAFKPNFLPTDVDTHSYIFPTNVARQTRPGWLPATWPGGFPADFDVDNRVVSSALPGYSFTNGLLTLPSVSIVTPSNGLFSASTGIYANSTSSGLGWERPAAVEMIFPDGRPGFHINCGIRIHGYSSTDKTMTPKHSFGLFFSSEFGTGKLDFPLFTNSPVHSFDRLVLRACSTDSWMVFNDPYSGDPYPRWSQPEASYMRDQWMRDSALAMGSVSARGQYVHLYLDGLYWGVYNLAERPDESFAASYLGGDKTEYDSLADAELHSGDLNAWNSLMQSAQSGLATDTAYQRVLGNNPNGTRNTNYPVLIHLTNLVDTMILHIYAGAVDWPHHNWWAARQRGPTSDGFRFFVWDQEISNNSLTRQHVDSVNIGNPIFTEVNAPNSPAYVYAAMRQNPEFRMLFGDRVHKHLFNDGVLSSNACMTRWNARAAEIDRAMVDESARWADYRRPSLAYKRETEWASNNNWIVNTYFPSNAWIALKRFRDANLYPTLGAPSFSQFGGNVPNGFPLAITHTNAAGTIYFTMDGADPRLPGGGLAASATAYTQSIAMNSPTMVRARVRNGTTWSAIVEARFTTPQDFSKLLISELHYNPPMTNGIDGEQFEFLELQNIGLSPLDLGGLSFTQGISFTFTNETALAPGAFFVLVRNPAQFATRFPAAPVNGIFSGKLDNGGETLTLAGPGGIVLTMSYDDVPPWPLEADGYGLSLQRANTAPDSSLGNNWTAALPTPGGPLPADRVDSDGDGIPDVWEIAHHLDPLMASDAAEDLDLDGVSNLAEFRAGTDPENPADYLRIKKITLANQSTLAVMSFEAAPNRSYAILGRPLLDHGCWTAVGIFEPQASAREVTFTNALSSGTSAAFYRIVTPAQAVICP